METIESQQANELQTLYASLRMWDLSVDERLDVLLQVKGVVQVASLLSSNC